ncbi:MAG: hypothetical protein JRC68_10355, partial [Deltaproteobacteria bacterium]|nr:hypothetical protein [Deltaproteobacteria bacterium]
MANEKGRPEFEAVYGAKARRSGKQIITDNLDSEFNKARSTTPEFPIVGSKQDPRLAIRRAQSGLGADTGMPKKGAWSADRVFDVPYNPFRNRLTVETPRNVVELNARYRFYAKYEPLVGAAVELHTEFPLSGFNIDHEDQEIADFFNDMVERLNMFDFLLQMASEYWTVGECIGDEVLTHTGSIKRVTDVKVNMSNGPLYGIRKRGSHQTLYCTGNHPVWAARCTDKGHKDFTFVAANKLCASDLILTPSSAEKLELVTEQVARIATYTYTGLVFNLEVEDDHSYVAEGIAVHNCFPFGFFDDPYDPTEWEKFILINPDNVVLETHPMILGRNNYNIFMSMDASITKIVEQGPTHEHTGLL